jgi:hypothetical protein
LVQHPPHHHDGQLQGLEAHGGALVALGVVLGQDGLQLPERKVCIFRQLPPFPP